MYFWASGGLPLAPLPRFGVLPRRCVPLGTHIVNLFGCFCIGLALGLYLGERVVS
jgi:fluoride ion exporter CrcB/FEX